MDSARGAARAVGAALALTGAGGHVKGCRVQWGKFFVHCDAVYEQSMHGNLQKIFTHAACITYLSSLCLCVFFSALYRFCRHYIAVSRAGVDFNPELGLRQSKAFL